MTGNVFYIVPLYFVLLVVLADDRVLLTEVDERRWNTPPELIPEQVIKTTDTKYERSLSIPITTDINVQTLGFQLGPEGISYSENNSFNRPLFQPSRDISQNESVPFAIGSAVMHDNQARSIQTGHATVAVSSTGSLNFPVPSISTNTAFSYGMTTIRFPGHNRPTWTNIRPNHNNNGQHPPRMPKLDIEVKPHREQNHRPITLHISAHEMQWNNRQPKIHIHKWQPSYRNYYDDEQT
ncbi:hypothetical protein ANTPLA_LOCUS6774 [Anthophora plagiata]